MKPARSVLLFVSVALVMVVLSGGLAVRVGAGENSYRQVVLFSEILGLVLDNYVDPVEPDTLLSHAYEGLLGGLDAQGAFLTADEVAEWKAASGDASGSPGLTVLKAGPSLQVVTVVEGSPAGQAGLVVGDQIRSVGGRSVRDLSLEQARRLLRGAPGSRVSLVVLKPAEGFERKTIELERVVVGARPFGLAVDRGIGVLTVRELSAGGAEVETLERELDGIRDRGVETLLIDLRNVADLEPRNAAAWAGVLGTTGARLQLRDRSGRLTDSVSVDASPRPWSGTLALLVNGATAGAAEALAALVRESEAGILLGEGTYGLGAEAHLFELEDGSGLLVPSAIWETGAGLGWNAGGIEPDRAIRGRGADFPAIAADQLEQAMDYLLEEQVPAAEKQAA